VGPCGIAGFRPIAELAIITRGVGFTGIGAIYLAAITALSVAIIAELAPLTIEEPVPTDPLDAVATVANEGPHHPFEGTARPVGDVLRRAAGPEHASFGPIAHVPIIAV